MAVVVEVVLLLFHDSDEFFHLRARTANDVNVFVCRQVTQVDRLVVDPHAPHHARKLVLIVTCDADNIVSFS